MSCLRYKLPEFSQALEVCVVLCGVQYVCVHVCMCACVRGCVRACVHACVHVCAYAYLCAYVFSYTNLFLCATMEMPNRPVISLSDCIMPSVL